ncbi:hypothetical protein BCR43DRAFT_497965 [Syncephalastrum racemosum]|uniref:UBR-type domain-containing protein n=1 Tax=Syncephalastrum racemosum TaxID=13706 RepID=A0A1X2H383_SYNRA|nr:hypothetical protein BCR43DRAFT_497965 [Syncephalastrum racemosum]
MEKDDSTIEKPETHNGFSEEVITAQEYIDRQTALEKEAQEVLPGKFEKCTFEQGYIRQALYACKTCTRSDDEPSGMCYSCSIACHSDHELLELFPKRNFRCDCGVPGKFGGTPCELSKGQQKATSDNDKNTYNHNFKGLYCRCNQFYDPEKEENEMYQCLVCEDWFHERCIGSIPEGIDDFDTYICRECTAQYPFLIQKPSRWCSIGLAKAMEPVHCWLLPPQKTEQAESEKHDGTEQTPETLPDMQISPPKEVQQQDANAAEPNQLAGQKRKTDEENIGSEKRPKNDEQARDDTGRKQNVIRGELDGVLKNTPSCNIVTIVGNDKADLFLQDGWRQHLCSCDNVSGVRMSMCALIIYGQCKNLLSKHAVQYLLKEEDTYEPEDDKDTGKSLMDLGMEQLNSVDRVKALEGIMAFQAMSGHLRDFLEDFRKTDKVVTEADIKRFFAEKRDEMSNRAE